jgi:hypothetical protein
LTTRRTFLAAGAGVLLAGPASVAAAAVSASAPKAAGPIIPRTLARRSGGPSPLRVERTSFPLSHLTVRWNGPVQPVVRIRSGFSWGSWQPIHACRGGKDGADAVGRCALLTTPGAVGYEIGSSGAAGEISATELNTVDGPARARAAAPADTLTIGGRSAPVRYLSRAAWGADESLRFGPDGTETWPPAYFPVQTLTVHHTATANNDRDPAATVRAIYYYHAVTQGWGDIGYQLLIDEAGTAYEGRWSGPDPEPVVGPDLGPDGRPQMVNGAHVGGFNAGNIGVALLGDFTSRQPTRAARDALTQVLALLAGVMNLDPLGTTNYVNPISGATRTVPTISGHRDWQPTECPGNRFYPKLPSVRRDVAGLLGAGAARRAVAGRR